ncbi:MAG: MgtC/SapB family protein [Candidatus Spechtbacterales bacterium]
MIFPDTEIIFQLILATVLGLILGVEREFIGKPAGMRTYALVSLGAATFTIISKYGFSDVGGGDFDPSRVASQIVTGIGFLGAGVIIFRGVKVEGLTTASGLWVSAAIGMAVGAGMYAVAAVACVMAFIVIVILRRFDIEHWFRKEEDLPAGRQDK